MIERLHRSHTFSEVSNYRFLRLRRNFRNLGESFSSPSAINRTGIAEIAVQTIERPIIARKLNQSPPSSEFIVIMIATKIRIAVYRIIIRDLKLCGGIVFRL